MKEINRRQHFIRYLLGDLTPEESETIENSFSDPTTFDEYLIAEEDLIDAYLRSELPAHQREQFETNYLAISDERKSRVRIARVVLDLAPIAAAAESSLPGAPAKATTWAAIKTFFSKYLFNKYVLQYVAAALVLAVLAGLVIDLKRQVDRMRAESAMVDARKQELEEEKIRFRQREQQLQQEYDEQRITRDRLAQQLQKESEEHQERVRQLMKELEQVNSDRARNFEALIFAFPHQTKGTTESPEIIRATAKWITIKLILTRDVPYTTYRADLEFDSNVISQDALKDETTRQGRAVGMRPIPADKIPEGNVTITLYGLDQDGKYQPVDGYTISLRKK